MAFHPDIIVVGTESPSILLVVEAKINDTGGERLSHDMKSYLVSMSCPTGLFVSPNSARIFRNTFSGFDERSVDEVGSFRLVPPLWKAPEGQTPTASNAQHFERFVQVWLEELAERKTLKGAPPEMQSAFESYVMPALAAGTIRAAGPRVASR